MQFSIQKTAALTAVAAFAYAQAAAVPVTEDASVYGGIESAGYAPAQVSEVSSGFAPSVEEVGEFESPVEEAVDFAPVSDNTAYTQAPIEQGDEFETEAPTVSSEYAPSIEDVEDFEVPESFGSVSYEAAPAPVNAGSSITYEQPQVEAPSGSSITYEEFLGEQPEELIAEELVGEEPTPVSQTAGAEETIIGQFGSDVFGATVDGVTPQATGRDSASFDVVETIPSNGEPVTYLSRNNGQEDVAAPVVSGDAAPSVPVVSGDAVPSAPVVSGAFAPEITEVATPEPTVAGVFPPSYVANAVPTGTGVSAPVDETITLIDTPAPSAGIDSPIQAIIDGEELDYANAYYQANSSGIQTLPLENDEYPVPTFSSSSPSVTVTGAATTYPPTYIDDEDIFANEEEYAAYEAYVAALESGAFDNTEDISGTLPGSLSAPISTGTIGGVEQPKVFYVRNGRPYFPQPTPYLPVPLHSNYVVNTTAFDPNVPLTVPTISKDTVLDPNEFDGQDVTEDELLQYIAPFANSTGVAGNGTIKAPEYYIPREVMRSMKLRVMEALDGVLGHY